MDHTARSNAMQPLIRNCAMVRLKPMKILEITSKIRQVNLWLFSRNKESEYC